MEWDDFRYFDAVARRGSVRGAAEQLGVNASTVTRRLERLEEELGAVLFLRTGQRLNITTEGVEVAQRVEEIGRHFRMLETSLKGRDQRLAGPIRVSVPDVLAVNFLLQDLAPFADMYPEIELELLPRYQPIDLTTHDVDVVVRATEEPPDIMVGRRLAGLSLAAYATPEFLQTHSLNGEARVPWVDWATPSEVMYRYADIRERYFPQAQVHIRCDQVEMQRASICAHLGMGLLPIFVGETDPRLIRVGDMPAQSSPTLWLLTHPDARSVRRIQVFLEFLRDVFMNRAEELFDHPLGTAQT